MPRGMQAYIMQGLWVAQDPVHDKTKLSLVEMQLFLTWMFINKDILQNITIISVSFQFTFSFRSVSY